MCSLEWDHRAGRSLIFEDVVGARPTFKCWSFMHIEEAYSNGSNDLGGYRGTC
jgi:hypothetical protein